MVDDRWALRHPVEAREGQPLCELAVGVYRGSEKMREGLFTAGCSKEKPVPSPGRGIVKLVERENLGRKVIKSGLISTCHGVSRSNELDIMKVPQRNK